MRTFTKPITSRQKMLNVQHTRVAENYLFMLQLYNINKAMAGGKKLPVLPKDDGRRADSISVAHKPGCNSFTQQLSVQLQNLLSPVFGKTAV